LQETSLLTNRINTIELPSLPGAVLKIIEMLCDKDVSLSELTRTIESDPNLASRILALANSVYYRQNTPVTTIRRAIVTIGLDVTATLASGAQLSSAMPRSNRLDFQVLWRDMLLRAIIARKLALHTQREIAAEAYLVGLLQSVGILVLDQVSLGYAPLFHRAQGCRQRLAELEQAELSFSHVDLLARLCQAWGLPEILSAPLLLQHKRPPERVAVEPRQRLWQISYIVNSLPISNGSIGELFDPTLTDLMQHCFGLSVEEICDLLTASAADFEATSIAFDDMIPRNCDINVFTGQLRTALQAAGRISARLSSSSVVLVDRGATLRKIVERMFKGFGCVELHHCATGKEAIEQIAATSSDLLVTSLHLPDMTALELRRSIHHEVPMLVLSSAPSDEVAQLKAQDLPVLNKPFGAPALKRALGQLWDW
jgi:HD-like signal output (HDOD) protein/CheY-like chemotaxis protein